MSSELNFEAMPFSAYEAVAPQQSGFAPEEEFGGRARSRSRRQSFAPGTTPTRLGRPPFFSRVGPKKPASPPPFPPRRPKWPIWPQRAVVAPAPFGVIAEPPAGPPAGSEYMRWVQRALNNVLGLRLPVDGIADAATRSAIRSFQQQGGLPADGVVGPDTERALIAARGGQAPQTPVAAGPTQPGQTPPVEEINSEGENFEHEFGDTQRVAERAAVKSRVAAGQHDPNALTDMVFFQRHPERRRRPLRADEYKLIYEWKAILRDVVLPELAHAGASPGGGGKVSEKYVKDWLDVVTKHKLPELAITLEQLLIRHQAEAGGIPIEVLLAFIHFEAGGQLNHNVTAGKWNEKYQKYIPSFYELGIFQTPAGYHGCSKEAGVKRCNYPPPGRNVEKSQCGKGWRYLAGTYPTASNWKDPTMQVRVGLWDLNTTADSVRNSFKDLFPSKQSEWYLRMAVLYSFAAGAGAARALLRTYKNKLLRLREGERWEFLRAENVGSAYFKNVDEKMALAAKLGSVRGAAVTRSDGRMQ